MIMTPLPRRILMTADAAGGIFDYVLELSGVLSARGVEVLLAATGTGLTDRQLQALNAIEGLKIFECPFRVEWMDEPLGDIDAAGEWLLEIENSTRPDVVHLNDYPHGSLPWRAPCMVVGHSGVLSGRGVSGKPAPTRVHEYERRVRRGLRHAALVVAPSRATLLALRESYGPLERSRVIYHGRRPRDLGSPIKQPFVFSIGRLWEEPTGMHTIDRAAVDLAWPALVAGSTEPRRIVSQVPSRPPEYAHFLGPLDSDAIEAMLGRAAIFAHPGPNEPGSFSVLEAALAECALVLADIPSLREIWQDAAIFVPPGDATALHRELGGLIENSVDRAAWGIRARRAARRFTASRMASEYLAAYRAVMSAPSARRDEENSAYA